MVRNHFWEAQLNAHHSHWGLDRTTVIGYWAGKCSHLIGSGTRERRSLHGRILFFTLKGRAERRQHECGVIWVSCLLMSTLRMVCTGHGQQRQVLFIDSILDTKRHCHDSRHPLLRNARPLVARICTQFLKAENSQFFA